MDKEKNEINYRKVIQALKPFTHKDIGKANYQFFITFFMLWINVLLSSYFIDNIYVLFITIPLTSVFMCRSYVIEHDCGHQSFYHSKIMNDIVGNIMGFGILIPYSMWKFIHNSHHSHVGNLDKRELNPEVWTMTTKEFSKSSIVKKLAYRFMRSKLTRLLIVPTINFGIVFRLIHPKFNVESIISVILHNAIYLLIFIKLISLISFVNFFLIFLLPLIIFYSIASFTFYAQHQFEDTYWEDKENWHYTEAVFNGATCIKAPFFYRWLTGNVTYHNVHHIQPSIPNYNLYEAEKKLRTIMNYKYYNITEIWHFLNLKLWDEEKKKLVSFRNVN
jgi:acyl-lipid omega-6 desaturase (Delta-12 desaturase)